MFSEAFPMSVNIFPEYLSTLYYLEYIPPPLEPWFLYIFIRLFLLIFDTCEKRRWSLNLRLFRIQSDRLKDSLNSETTHLLSFTCVQSDFKFNSLRTYRPDFTSCLCCLPTDSDYLHECVNAATTDRRVPGRQSSEGKEKMRNQNLSFSFFFPSRFRPAWPILRRVSHNRRV